MSHAGLKEIRFILATRGTDFLQDCGVVVRKKKLIYQNVLLDCDGWHSQEFIGIEIVLAEIM